MSPWRSVEAPLSSGQYVSCQSVPVPLSISFSGSGFLATYQLGVAQSMLDRSPWVLQAAPKVMGASAGSLVAAAVVCVCAKLTVYVCLSRLQCVNLSLQCVNLRLQWYTAIDRSINMQNLVMVSVYEPDSLTAVLCFPHMEALLCGCFLPGYCGIQPPSYKGVHYLDGGFSSIQPTNFCPIGHTITVSPFAGETDICPKDPAPLCDVVVSGANLHCSLVNGYRMLDAMYPYNWEV
ncbi:patatin-like phospholipase domain-containing protein 1 [Salmo trutta]|uniref:patatin-like phospholipase domain-containing protein 1 n=1 Tax=Salmo trutta TaxID=8032 RepID=UPI0011320F60|nr:patatin-like phospholipase domain-containing protein 1 [Salmo trutta]